jgi:hypothetical protein
MKILLDTRVWGGTKYDLQAAGHDVIWGILQQGAIVTASADRIRVRTA